MMFNALYSVAPIPKKPEKLKLLGLDRLTNSATISIYSSSIFSHRKICISLTP